MRISKAMKLEIKKCATSKESYIGGILDLYLFLREKLSSERFPNEILFHHYMYKT